MERVVYKELVMKGADMKDIDIAQTNYNLGLEIGLRMVKEIFALSKSERVERFGKSDVAAIIDDFDFGQLKNLMSREVVLKKKYVIRAIKEIEGKKKVMGESIRYTEYPSEDLLMAFWGMYPEATFIVVEEVYVKEFKVEP